jgi:hypothetical protein
MSTKKQEADHNKNKAIIEAFKAVVEELSRVHYFTYFLHPEGETKEGYEERKQEGIGFIKALATVDAFMKENILILETGEKKPESTPKNWVKFKHEGTVHTDGFQGGT